MKPIRKKKYKSVTPEITIRNIRNILQEKLRVDVKEVLMEEKSGLFYSSHIQLSNEWLQRIDIATNGKGMSKDYSLASAYGEMMERIQSGILFNYREYAHESFVKENKEKYQAYIKMLEESDSVLCYLIAPDEEIVTNKKNIEESIEKYVVCIDKQVVKEEAVKQKVVFLPYYNASDGKVEKLPISIIDFFCGSNGMCAGNNPEEAIIQGLSEIFERYALREIYRRNLALPTIPNHLFEGSEIYEKIRTLEQTENIEIQIKDCSCGIGLPAVGVLIFDQLKSRYQFHIGVDPSPITALERSMSELFQGKKEIFFHDIDVEFQTALMTDIEQKEEERISYSWGRNRYPISIFSEIPDYEFKGFCDKWGESDKNDLKLMINLIHDLGFKLYIRDVSFLDFPAYSLYIPGMSEWVSVFSMKRFKTIFPHKNKIFRLSHSIPLHTHEDTKELSTLLSCFNDPVFVDFLNPKDVWMTGNKYFLFAILCFHSGDIERALTSINKAINTISSSPQKVLFRFISESIILEQEGKRVEIEKLKSSYPVSIFESGYQCLFSEKWKDYFNFTTCFECDLCMLSNSCKAKGYFKFMKHIEELYRLNLPEQENLKNIV